MPTALPPPWRDEAAAVAALRERLAGFDWAAVRADAQPWVDAVRRQPAPFWALESLMREYPISSAEGLALMRLAEALLRVPDTATAMALTADQLGAARFDAPSHAAHPVLAGLASTAIGWSKHWLSASEPAGLLQRLGAQAVVAAAIRAVQLLGRQFVLGRDIGEALSEAASAQRGTPQMRFSFDMLGEGARTAADAQRYAGAYAHAIEAIAATGRQDDGVSVKLSALFPRFEEAQRAHALAALLPRVQSLIDRAARAGLQLTIDAEESDRLQLSLDLVDALAAHVARRHVGWTGFGLAVQAYQTRALDTIDALRSLARQHAVRLNVRLVKGAYWDGEIKRAQTLGLPGYPVFTHKAHTDLSYLACAQALLASPVAFYPQFATHNAGTLAAVVRMAQTSGSAFEVQRLHGMGEAVHRELQRAHPSLPVRLYAPVGEHRDLLAYLVRRLLENGANSSFVHQLVDEAVSPEVLLASPLLCDGAPGLPSPGAIFGTRPNSIGCDLAHAPHRDALVAALDRVVVDEVAPVTAAEALAAMQTLQAGFDRWHRMTVDARAAVLVRAADALQLALPDFAAHLVREGGKTWDDAVSEVREAIDFCRYYADEARTHLADRPLPGPTGERNVLRLRGRGVFVCISPWNFPLAIFTGQVVAALVAGNAVAAKPAEQTPAIARRMVTLLHEAGVPPDALVLVPGAGEDVGAALVGHDGTAGVCFTGSTAVARQIHRQLAAKDGPIVPLIAETGGLNAMLVDSTALPEQVVDAVVQSAFRSAGQRCSALRLLCLHEAIAEPVIEMLRGAMALLRVGDPSHFDTDVGPVIDADARMQLRRHVDRLRGAATLLAESPPSAIEHGHFIAPIAFEIARIADLTEEIFGPVLHVVRWSGEIDDVVAQVNALGYGLTIGVQTRIDRRAERIADLARIGNVYVNRNTVGAVVGVQPFGGEGLSGTGPKAGGPHYLPRFCREQTVTVNTSAAGGDVDLLAGAG